MAGAPLGNDNAKRTKPWRDAIDRALAQDDGKRLRSIAEKLLTLAANGEMSAIKELGDRLDGKAAQSVIVGEDPDNPFASELATARSRVLGKLGASDTKDEAAGTGSGTDR